jgi:hypothetical protein
MIALFREIWREASIGTRFRDDENPHVLRTIGEELVAKTGTKRRPRSIPRR